MPLIIALLALLIALVGAVLHPVVLFVSLLPVDASELLAFLERAKVFIADFLFWAFLAVVVGASGTVIVARAKRRPAGRVAAEQSPSQAVETIMAPRVVVAVTAYNDAEATAMTVREFKAQPGVVEVIVVDNNSTDDTAVLATRAGARVVRETQQGYGYACMRGLREALQVPAAEIVVLTEGDGTFVGSDLAKFRAYLGEADMVLGTRVVPGLVEQGSQMDHFFIWGNIAVSWLLRLRFWNTQFLGAVRLSDMGCTYRAIRREALAMILPDLSVGGSHFSAHMMLVALERGLSVVEIPIRFRRRIGESKGGSRSLGTGLSVGLAMIWHILTHRVPRRRDDAANAELTPAPGPAAPRSR